MEKQELDLTQGAAPEAATATPAAEATATPAAEATAATAEESTAKETMADTTAVPAEEEKQKPKKKKKGWPVGARILLWLGIIALVIFLTLFIVATIVPDERINSIGDLINYLVTEFQAL